MPLNAELVKNSLAGHGWLGLFVGAAMYVICLSGALLVFHIELERWEQPNAPEFTEVDVVGMQATFNEFLATDQVTPHMYLVLPTKDSPRARLATENASWFLNQDGSLAEQEAIGWTDMLLKLHLYLHLPEAWGMLVVSITGVMLIALIITGLMAHTGIFRDAFALRIGGSKQLEQTDIHNRLSVWGAPFFLMIAITGAYFGLAIPNLTLYSEAELDGDRDKAISALFGEEPALNESHRFANVVDTLNTMQDLAPEAETFLFIMHDAGEPNAHISVSAFHPGRFVYSENYLFSIDGQFLSTVGFLDGPIGKQVVYSIYRLHFGTFAGTATKWAYLLLGLGLAAVSATGVNIWLARRRRHDGLNHIWVGIVWGLPVALCFSFLLKMSFGAAPLLALWLTVIGSCALALYIRDEFLSRLYLRLFCGALMVSTGLIHTFIYIQDQPSSFDMRVNGALIVPGMALLALSIGLRLRQQNNDGASGHTQ